MDTIKNVIITILNQFRCEVLETGKLGEKYYDYWTQEILWRLHGAGKHRGYEVFSRWQGNEMSDQWPGHDMVWLKRVSGNLHSVELALMVEWNASPRIEECLDKLMCTRANIRVLVFDATYPWAEAGEAEGYGMTKINELAEHIDKYADTQDNDEYLFCLWSRDSGPDPQWSYVLRSETINQSPPDSQP